MLIGGYARRKKLAHFSHFCKLWFAYLRVSFKYRERGSQLLHAIKDVFIGISVSLEIGVRLEGVASLIAVLFKCLCDQGVIHNACAYYLMVIVIFVVIVNMECLELIAYSLYHLDSRRVTSEKLCVTEVKASNEIRVVHRLQVIDEAFRRRARRGKRMSKLLCLEQKKELKEPPFGAAPFVHFPSPSTSSMVMAHWMVLAASTWL